MTHPEMTPVPSHLQPLPFPFTHTTPAPNLIAQGAESLLYHTHFLNPSTPAALKFRPSKPYRHPTLDQRLTKQRVLAEARVLVKLSGLKGEGVVVPTVYSLEWDTARKVRRHAGSASTEIVVERGMGDGRGTGAWLLMEWIEGRTVKELLRRWDVWAKTLGESEEDETMKRGAEEEVKKLLRRIGSAVGVMHAKGGVVHGDLTSSNVMVRPAAPSEERVSESQEAVEGRPTRPSLDGEIVLIDFGLATQSVQEEDRAVDLYVLERAFGSTHPKHEDLFDQEVLRSDEGYRGSYAGSKVVLKRLEDVRLRGRKRSMVG